MTKFEVEEMILGMADIVIENRQLRDELRSANQRIKNLEERMEQRNKQVEEAMNNLNIFAKDYLSDNLPEKTVRKLKVLTNKEDL